MEGELWKRVYELLVISGKKYSQAKVQYSTRRIVAVYLWAVLHDRPTCWACDERNWPEPSLGDLPSPSCMSRRLANGTGASVARGPGRTLSSALRSEPLALHRRHALGDRQCLA